MTLPQNLAQFPELLSDSRVEPIWDRLRQELHLPDEVSFATYEQPPRTGKTRSPGGIEYEATVPAQAVFIVVSPNPHKRFKGKMLKTFAICDLRHWREKEGQAWRYVGVGDPAFPIFKALAKQHLAERKNFEELI